MSYGIVICSNCSREVHQDGDRGISNGWRHCEDGLPICPGAHAAFPDSTADIKGEWCGRDAGPDERPETRWTSLTAVAIAATASLMVTLPLPMGGRSRPRKVRRGNKYRLCECGSYKPWANCCGAKGGRHAL